MNLPKGTKEIPGYPGYHISENGDVYSSRSGHLVKLSSRVSNSGYDSVTVTDAQGNRTPQGIHRLLALAYLPNDDPTKTEVNHIDGEKDNNKLSNLEWVSHSENEHHKVNSFLTNRTRPIRITEVATGRVHYAPSTRKAAAFFGVSASVIGERLREYNHGPYRGCILEFVE